LLLLPDTHTPVLRHGVTESYQQSLFGKFLLLLPDTHTPVLRHGVTESYKQSLFGKFLLLLPDTHTCALGTGHTLVKDYFYLQGYYSAGSNVVFLYYGEISQLGHFFCKMKKQKTRDL